jgi:hypothetical protein
MSTRQIRYERKYLGKTVTVKVGGRKVKGIVTSVFYGRNECWNLKIERKGAEWPTFAVPSEVTVAK